MMLALAAIPAASDISAAADRVKSDTTVYTNLSLVDGYTLRHGMAIVVEDERISKLVSTRELTRSETSHSQTFDGKGAFVVPGLIDTHVHLATSPDRQRAEAAMRRDLFSGITAVRDMAGDARVLADLSRAALLQEIPGPDVYYAALMAGPGFFRDARAASSAKGTVPGRVSWMQAIRESTDMPLAVAFARGTGATGIKLYANLSRDLVIKVTTEAHKQGIAVWSHATVFPAIPRDAVDAKVDVISHVCWLADEFSSDVSSEIQTRKAPDYARIDPAGAAMGTLLDRLMRQATILDATLRTYAEAERQAAKNRTSPPRVAPCPLDYAARLTAEAHRHGVLISTGTDSALESSDDFPALFEELELLQNKAGISAAEILRSATVVGAMTLGAEKDLGSLQVGELANFVLLSKNPLVDVGNLRSVVMTVKRGTQYARSDFKPLVSDESPPHGGD